MELVVISGLSGSGKSIALAVLEDAGYYCVDNLPADMLPVLVGHLRRDGYTRIGVAVDVRSGPSLEALPKALEDLRRDARVSVLFLDASDETLLQRFSETRRAHPLTSETMTLAEALRHERALLEPVAEMGHRLDSSHLKPAVLRAWIREFLKVDSQDGLTLVFESFGFKHG
ncbi:MAG: RNase adapter RapZ, partial [Fluviibacter sp.]